ncbi:unnamed protein product [Prunus brigantina]
MSSPLPQHERHNIDKRYYCVRIKTNRISIGYDARHRLHQWPNCIALWLMTLVTSFRPIARCNGSLGRSCLRRCRRRCSDSCRYVSYLLNKAAKANKGNRNKKTLLYHLGSRAFLYRMEARRRGGSKFPKIDVFGDVYVRAGNELAESLHATMLERSWLVLHESSSQLPPDAPLKSVDPPQDAGFQILTETLDQTLGNRPETYCHGMGNAKRWEPIGPLSSQSNQVTALTAEVAELKTQLASYSTQMAQMS